MAVLFKLQAIVAAFDLAEPGVADWRDRAGLHGQKVHKALLVQANLDLGHVQADEIRAKAPKKVVWLAMALMVSTRLWLGDGSVWAFSRELLKLEERLYLFV
jgi:hypothetical protein